MTEHSDALALEPEVFKSDDPREIAKSLKKSAEESHKRKSEPYRSAMSMLTFYINRAGKNLPQKRKKVLEKAKDELAPRIRPGLTPARRLAHPREQRSTFPLRPHRASPRPCPHRHAPAAT